MSDDTIDSRLRFMKLDEGAQRRLLALKPILMDELPPALDSFYDQVRSFPQTMRFFSGEARIESAKSRQVGHWGLISQGEFGADYVSAVTAVGEIHARIGLEPRWYIGGYALVLERLVARVLRERWPRRGFGARAAGCEALAEEIGALLKATLLDMDFAISVYLAAAEEMRVRAERETLQQERSSVVASVGEAMAALARGELAYRMSDAIPAEYEQLRADFNLAMDHLQQTMRAIAEATTGVSSSSGEIADASVDLSRRTEQQAANLEETAATLDEITVTVRRNAEGARTASAVASTTKTDVERSGDVMQAAVEAIRNIEQSSHKVAQITGLIDEIAFQTNLLALNAGVEAARAGDAGRGFAVVAQEVRGLAQRSAQAAKEIKGLISESAVQVESGVKLVGDTCESLTGIAGKVAEIDQLIAEIARISQEQATGLAQVNAALNQMDEVTQRNAAMVEETTAAAASLRNEARELSRRMEAFSLDDLQSRSAAGFLGATAPRADLAA